MSIVGTKHTELITRVTGIIDTIAMLVIVEYLKEDSVGVVHPGGDFYAMSYSDMATGLIRNHAPHLKLQQTAPNLVRSFNTPARGLVCYTNGPRKMNLVSYVDCDDGAPIKREEKYLVIGAPIKRVEKHLVITDDWLGSSNRSSPTSTKHRLATSGVIPSETPEGVAISSLVHCIVYANDAVYLTCSTLKDYHATTKVYQVDTKTNTLVDTKCTVGENSGIGRVTHAVYIQHLHSMILCDGLDRCIILDMKSGITKEFPYLGKHMVAINSIVVGHFTDYVEGPYDLEETKMYALDLTGVTDINQPLPRPKSYGVAFAPYLLVCIDDFLLE